MGTPSGNTKDETAHYQNHCKMRWLERKDCQWLTDPYDVPLPDFDIWSARDSLKKYLAMIDMR